jgi:hypothetical protein
MVADGDAADLVRDARCGINSHPSADGVSEALLNLDALSHHDLATMGRNGAGYYRQHLHFDLAANQFARILEAAA